MENKIRVMTLILVLAITIVFLYIAYSLFISYSAGEVEFKSDAISIFGSIIQGMSGLLSVSIAVIVFRIQSLENRKFSLEQTTLNYIHDVIGFSYPKWLSSVEDDIRNRVIVNRYYEKMIRSRTNQIKILFELDRDKMREERDIQQERLEETLNEHTRISQTIKRTRDGIISSFILLISPIILSLLMLMMSDALTPLGNYGFVVTAVLVSAIGIIDLINTVVNSTVQDN